MKSFPVLAIDYGSARLGIAISDANGTVASPLKTIDINKSGGLNEAIQIIRRTVKEYNAARILIGMPQAFTEKQQKTQEKVRKFADQVKTNIGLEIVFYDESFSTTKAENVLVSLGHNTTSGRKVIDKLSAAIFLQNFLNNESNKANSLSQKENP